VGAGQFEEDKQLLTIDEFPIREDSDCYVIAEIGHNHQGSVELAKELIQAAADCGANAVKTQKRSNRSLYTDAFFAKPYDNENSFGATYGEHREALEFGRDEYLELIRFARDVGITFFATAFDFESADFLADLDMPAYKIASGDLTNTPLLRYVAEIGKPVIFSTGGGVLDDVVRAYETVSDVNDRIGILQCTAGYPAAWEQLDLRVIEGYRTAFPDAAIGYSGHDSGIAMAVIAYTLGARIVEKHFTLNRAMKGTDHVFSLEPQGLSKLVRDLRRARVALGDGHKHVYESEFAPIEKMAKTIVAARHLPVGHVLGDEDLALKSPAAGGLRPYELERLRGTRLLTPLVPDQVLTMSHVEAVPEREPAVDATPNVVF
jgi:N-acetylneuraminate synthase/sialic acid synthase